MQFTYARVKADAPEYERGGQRVDHPLIVLVASGLPGLSEQRHQSVDENARSGGHQLAARKPAQSVKPGSFPILAVRR